MQLPVLGLVLMTVATAKSSNYTEVTMLVDTTDRQSYNNEALNNIKSHSNDNSNSRNIIANNHKSDENDELSMKNNAITNYHLHHTNNNNNNSAVAFDNSSDFDTMAISSRKTNNNNPSLSKSAAGKYATLPRHQRSIAAVAKQRGLLQQVTDGERILRRGKRYLQFAKGSRVSWRTTGKNNILKVNTLWGYGYGFRANFPFPGPEESRRPFFKRDVLHSLADVLDGHGLDGRACILKSYCTAAIDVDSNISAGMLFKMLKLIFT
ncbi:PREDICTED: GATA zinc finger domain-containing protein 4-like [Rhagoletis zephyria]|uniref:GATA zinc finger domain-containing protein 4-like n=1 Tax=Rhagoletis zephyria TaxID=28612 RepID=UPI00081169A5|nr:PREDICTED: GATA zinc finger domain-containing protein 4-like [Rhagoletis zephyria]